MSCEEEEKLLFPSFAFLESFPEDANAGAGGEQRKARQRRRRKARVEAAAAAAAGESGGEDQSKKRRLSDEQARFLEMSFKKERKLETPRKVQLAAELGLDAKQVAVWFQNRRARHKNKLMEEEYSKLRAAHDAIVLKNCHLETQVLKLKEKLAEVEEEKMKLITAAATTGTAAATGGGSSSPSSSSFSTVTYHPALVAGQFGVEAAAADEPDLTYMSEYAYNNYMLDLAAAAGYCGGVYDEFS